MTDKKKATSDDMNEIHGLVAKLIKKSLEKEEVSDKALDVALKFLKDNSIQADIEFSEPLSKIKDAFDKAKPVNSKTLPFPTRQAE